MELSSKTTSATVYEALLAALAGVLFSVGLAVAGMTQPEKVLSFLDFFGAWDPSLAFVMLGAITVYFSANRFALKRSAPILDSVFHLPARRDIDSKLLLGAAVFGVGWGLAGYCPGPALSSLATLKVPVLVFCAAMACGMLVPELMKKRAE